MDESPPADSGRKTSQEALFGQACRDLAHRSIPGSFIYLFIFAIVAFAG